MTRKGFVWTVVKWKNIEALLLEHYEVGTSKEGADAFPPLLLMKGMLLQKWFPSGLEAYGPAGIFPRILSLRTRPALLNHEEEIRN